MPLKLKYIKFRVEYNNQKCTYYIIIEYNCIYLCKNVTALVNYITYYRGISGGWGLNTLGMNE